MKFALLLVVLALLFLGCTENTTGNNNPPWKPKLIQHLGNTGDSETATFGFQTPEEWTDVTVFLNEETNGIDAVPGNDWIKIQWVPFIDSDLDFMRIYRFPLTSSTEAEVVLVDSLRIGPDESYEDKSLTQQGFNPVNTEWVYFIEVVGHNGESSVSDSVSYLLLEKPLLTAPVTGTTSSASSELKFSWQVLSGGESSQYRLILFDEDHNYVWHYDETFTYTDPDVYFLEAVYNGDLLEQGNYYWRVDALGEAVDVSSGSESNERLLIIVQ